MYSPLPFALKPARVLFLARSEGSVRMDAKALRGLGVQHCAHESESGKALALLVEESARRKRENDSGPIAGNAVDLVICDEQLADVPASVLLYQLSRNPELSAQPVLVLASSSASAASLRAAGVHVLQRPYSADELGRAMQKAMSPLRGRLAEAALTKASAEKGLLLSPKAPAAPKKEKARPLTTSDLYAQGLAARKNGRVREAEGLFLRVLDRQEDHVGAALALARICRARDDIKGMRVWLVRATAASLRLGDKGTAESIAAILPEAMRRNIFAHEAAGHIEQGEYRPAALSFLDAGRDRPEIPLHRQVARVCLLTPKPDESMHRLCGAFDKLGHNATAAFLRRRLLSYEPYEETQKSSWLDNYPRLQEAFCVAAYTAKVWRQT